MSVCVRVFARVRVSMEHLTPLPHSCCRLRDSEIATLKSQVQSMQLELEEAREKARQANALLRQEVANSEKEAQLRASMEERHSQTQVIRMILRRSAASLSRPPPAVSRGVGSCSGAAACWCEQ